MIPSATVPASAVMPIFRPTMRPHACFISVSRCFSLSQTPALSSSFRVPFHPCQPAISRTQASTPSRNAWSSTQTGTLQTALSSNGAARSSARVGSLIKAHGAIPSSCAVPASAGILAQRKGTFCDLPQSRDLAFKAREKSLQRRSMLRNWNWTLRDPRPSVDTIVARSSLFEVIIDVIVFLTIVLPILFSIVIVALVLTGLIMVSLAFAWRSITGCRPEKIQLTCHTCKIQCICHTCGKERVEWYFKARLPGHIVTEPCCSFGSEER